MSNQLLFPDTRLAPADCGPAPHVATDTSSAAAIAIDPLVNQLRKRVYDFIRETANWGSTDEELCRALDLRGDTGRARRCELRDGGLVRDSGSRRKTSSGRLAICWVITDNPRCHNEMSVDRPGDA